MCWSSRQLLEWPGDTQTVIAATNHTKGDDAQGDGCETKGNGPDTYEYQKVFLLLGAKNQGLENRLDMGQHRRTVFFQAGDS